MNDAAVHLCRRPTRGGFAILIAFVLTCPAHAALRPNILFIMSDDHAYQAVSAYGSNRNQTPNIDRIAAEGIRFDRCLVTNSICAPSRATILTGKYSHKNGLYDNYSVFDGSQMTFPKLLQAAGYQTALIGKWHLKSDPTGFDYWDKLPGQGKYYRPDFETTSGRRAVPGYASDLITDFALEWLDNRRNPEQPFVLMVQHKAPHRPWDPGPEHIDDFADTNFPEPETLFDDYTHRSAAARDAEMRIDQMRPSPDLKIWEATDQHRVWLYGHMRPDVLAAWKEHYDPRWGDFHTANPTGRERVRWFYQLYMKDYLRCVASVDDSVGRLLEYLDKQNLAENTLVIYTSDQGFYLGEHGWFDKRFMYEESLRTPLVMRWPGTIEPGRSDSRLVSNVDFAPTFLKMAGATVPEDMQGRSMLPLLKGELPEDWRRSFYYHYYEGARRDHHVYKHEGVTTDRYKLIHYYPLDEWELFDLEEDPHELHSVYGDPDYQEQQVALNKELERLKTELEVPSP